VKSDDDSAMGGVGGENEPVRDDEARFVSPQDGGTGATDGDAPAAAGLL
jgi:hypothetical protein